ncbi:MAG: SGNH/GDSL hydrolase family protein [Planctomycetota bacterium]|nr:SGNH/GDSL hydrolase family protein [Planctomycetota bacterium]
MSDLTKILFIGNSYTFCNDLPKMLEGLVADALGRTGLATQFTGVGGWTFEQHWKDGKARALIGQGGWDYVVLQEQTRRPYEDTPKFREYATLLSEAAGKAGARTVLYLTWRTEWETDFQAKLNKAYGELGRDLKAPVVPSGVAFEIFHADRKGIDPFGDDRRHPNEAGSYLSACTFYAWLRNESPEGRTARVSPRGGEIAGCSPEQVRHLQSCAWQGWCAWRDGKIAI